MNRNSIQAIIMSLILTAMLPAPLAKAAGGSVVRVGESDRYATAAKVATTNWNNPKDLILVCGEGYADAVSASVLSKKLDAPIIMTNSKSLNENAKNALNTLKPQNVYVIGGYSSVSKSIRSYLTDSSYNVIELSGKNRYETNIAVANELVKLGMTDNKVMLVSGEGFSDALSVAPIAAAKGEILLLGTNDSNQMNSVFDFVKNNNLQVTVVGTSNSINDKIYNELKAVERVNGGANRFETNLNILKKFKGDLKTDKLFVANATSEDGYADALVASSLAGKYASSLVLVDGENDSATQDAIGYIKGYITDNTDLNVIGGTGVVSDALVSKIKSDNNQQPPIVDKPVVQSVTAAGLNQVKVTFNTNIDKDTAEVLSNYQIDGERLSSSYKSKTVATMQDDKRTVLITFSKPFSQKTSVDFEVKNGILDEKLSNIINEYNERITFSDNTSPNVSVNAVGGNKLVIKFSKPLRMKKDDLNLLKINKKSIQSFSLNKSQTVLLGEADDWVNGAELYFDSTLPEGDNTLLFPDGNVGQNFDTAAEIPLQSVALSFSVKQPEGFPQVKNVTSTNADTVCITYDRPMDRITALDDNNYKINDKSVNVNSWDVSFEEGSNDTIVKIKGVGELVKKGENKVVISDNIGDTYGNKIRETNTTFNIGSDNIIPQVTGISIIDNKTIRVKFNKPVTDYSATNKSNYKIIDNSDSSDITYKINSITGVSTANGYSMDAFDIQFNNINDLKSSSYTVNIKNIYDENKPANIMGNYTGTVTGDGGKVKVDSIVKKDGSNRDVVVFFNKAMDPTTINDYRNYFFVDGKGNTRDLPSNAIVAQSDDHKSVTITFPSGYRIGTGSTDRYVNKFGVHDVKDESGNLLEFSAYSGQVSEDYNQGPSLVEDTGKLVYDGNNAVLTVSVTNNLDVLDVNDFSVAGQKPDRGDIEGNTIKLTFLGTSDNKKVNAIRAAGNRTSISVSSQNTSDAAGRKIKSGGYTLLLPPVTDSSDWTAQSSNNSITMKFNQNIDRELEESYNDDFIFTNERTGKKLNVIAVRADDFHDIIYTFEDGSMKSGDVIDVRANDNPNNINIRGKEYGNGVYAIFSPSKEDLNIRTVVVH